MKRLLLIVPAIVLLASPALAEPPRMNPAQALAAAAADPDDGAPGIFEFVVQSVGSDQAKQGTVVYLNSDPDYRMPTNLSIMLMPQTAKDLQKKLGRPLDKTAIGKRFAVNGIAKQQRVDERKDGERTGRYYFQTRVTIKNIDKIEVLP